LALNKIKDTQMPFYELFMKIDRCFAVPWIRKITMTLINKSIRVLY